MTYLLTALLCLIALQLHRINRKIKHMSTTLTEALSKLNDATNAIAAEVALLRSELANVATPEQLAALDGIADRLTGLAADPGNPVPAPTAG